MAIQKEEQFSENPKLEAAMNKIYRKAQAVAHRNFSEVPTTADLQKWEMGILSTSSYHRIYINDNGTIKYSNLT